MMFSFFHKNRRKLDDRSYFAMIRNVLVHVIIIFLAFFIQTSIFPLIPFFTCSPNLLLIITFSYGLLYGEDIGIITGVFCGFLCDMYLNGEFGLYILIYSLLGYLNGTLKNSFFDDSISLPMMLSIANGFFYNFYIYFSHFLIRKKFDLIYYIFKVMLPNVLFTLIATVIIYKFLIRKNR